MDAGTEEELRRGLDQLTLEPTGRPLGKGGSRYTLEIRDGVASLEISFGFPAELAAEELLRSVRDLFHTIAPDTRLELSSGWKVESHAVQPGVKAIPGISNIIAVASGKGGVGKSTVTTNLAIALSREGARVGILDADIYGPSQPRLLRLMGERPETEDGKTLRPLLAFGLKVMSIGFLVEDRQAVAWRGPMVTSALNQMLTQTDWGELDYLIVDMPPGTGDVQLTLAQKVPVSGAVIVTTPQDIALADARKAVDMFNKVKLPVLGVIENMAVFHCSNCGHAEHIFGAQGGSALAAECELPVLGSLPLHKGIRELSDAGTPVANSSDDEQLVASFGKLALRVAGELAATARNYSHLFPNVTVEGK